MIRRKLSVVDWNIGFISVPIRDLIAGKEYSIEWMKHRYIDRFFADPFIVSENETFYVILAEEYKFVSMKGIIVKLLVEKKKKRLIKRELVLKTEYHLSYPFIYNGQMCPEQSKSNKWIGYNTAGVEKKELSNIGLVDATVLQHGSKDWVFATMADGTKDGEKKNLCRFELNDKGTVNLATKLCIKNSLSNSRPAGNFFEIDGTLYRPAQNSTETVYGESITINKVITNTDVEYREEAVCIIHSHDSTEYNVGMHTLNLLSNGVIIDGSQLSFRPLQKIASKFLGRRKK